MADSSSRFDALAKELAQGMSRREALRRCGGVVAGLLLASLGIGKAAAQGPGTGQGAGCGNTCNRAYSPRDPATKAANQQCKEVCEACEATGDTFCLNAQDGTAACCSRREVCQGGACIIPSTCSDGGFCYGGPCGNGCTCLLTAEGTQQCVAVPYGHCARYEHRCRTTADCPEGTFCIWVFCCEDVYGVGICATVCF